MQTKEQEITQKEKAQNSTLGHLWELCYRAHTNVSFSPERRASSYVIDYSQQLDEDLKRLGDNAGNYKAKYIAKFTDWMNAKSRCLSSMITGPSNFPVRKAQKANNSEHNKYQEFANWREKYFKAVNRVPTKSPEDEIEIAEKKLEEQLQYQIELKQINAAIRKSKLKDHREILEYLMKLDNDFSPNSLKQISTDYRGGYRVPGFVLTNLNARIKGTKAKLVIMQNRIERKMTFEDIVFEGGYVTIEDDRFKVFHDEKPSREVIQEIKSSGFRWSPNWKCWCRKHTGNALYAVQNLSFIKNAS